MGTNTKVVATSLTDLLSNHWLDQARAARDVWNGGYGEGINLGEIADTMNVCAGQVSKLIGVTRLPRRVLKHARTIDPKTGKLKYAREIFLVLVSAKIPDAVHGIAVLMDMGVPLTSEIVRGMVGHRQRSALKLTGEPRRDVALAMSVIRVHVVRLVRDIGPVDVGAISNVLGLAKAIIAPILDVLVCERVLVKSGAEYKENK